MTQKLRSWPLTFSLYLRCSGLSHRLRLRLYNIEKEVYTYIVTCETDKQLQPRRFSVYQQLWGLPFYLHRPDIYGVILETQFFHGIPTSTCFLGLGCRFILVERIIATPILISSRQLDGPQALPFSKQKERFYPVKPE